MGMFEAVQKWIRWSQIFVSMIIVQLFVTGMQLLSKVVLGKGTFIFAFLTYRHVVAALFLSPFVFFFERFASATSSSFFEGRFMVSLLNE